MAKGQILKKQVTDKILETFKGSFLYNDGKEIRINGIEDGENLQVKVTLTVAKTAVEPGQDTIEPAAALNFESPIEERKTVIQPTAEEKQNVATLLAKLGL
jgi:hypothetical protein